MISPGDVVTCVTLTPPCGCTDYPPGSPQPVVGRHYRVLDTFPGRCNICRDIVPCLTTPDHDPSKGDCWPVSIFERNPRTTLAIPRVERIPA